MATTRHVVAEKRQLPGRGPFEQNEECPSALALACGAVMSSQRRRRRIDLAREGVAVPSWCGPKKTARLHGRLRRKQLEAVTTASARNEASKCPSVTSIDYADGQGNTQKAISDIQGMVAKGLNAIVVFPDAGKAILPALRSSYKAGVVTVPYRVTPGGKAGVDYNVFVDTPFSQAGENWGRWILRAVPKGGNVLMLSGPKGNSQGIEGTGPPQDPRPHGRKVIGEQP